MTKIIAIDFDGTLCEDCYPDIGPAVASTIAAYRRERAKGTKFILWTCRYGERLNEALRWCDAHGVFFDAVNAHLPEHLTKYGWRDTRKVYADIYWDDRAVGLPR